MFSKDPNLMAVYQNRLDFHSASAKAAFSINKDMTADKEELLTKGMVAGSKEFELEIYRRELLKIKKENGDARTRAKSVSFGKIVCRSKTRSIAGKPLCYACVRTISSQSWRRRHQMVQRLIG